MNWKPSLKTKETKRGSGSDTPPTYEFKPLGEHATLVDSRSSRIFVRVLVFSFFVFLFAWLGWMAGYRGVRSKHQQEEWVQPTTPEGILAAQRRAKIGLLVGACAGALAAYGLMIRPYHWSESRNKPMGRGFTF